MNTSVPSAPDEDANDPRKGIQSVETGLRIAGVLAAAGGPLPLREVARASGLAGGAAHRYLVSLVRAGLATQSADGRYDLGGFSLRLGFAALSRLEPIKVAERHLEAHVDATGSTAMMTLWSERGPIVMRWLQGAKPVYTTIAVGTVMPLATSATGAIFLAWLAPRQTDALLREAPNAERKILARTITSIRAAGHASVAGDLVPGLHAVAVPVFDGSGALIAAFTAVAAGESITPEAIANLKASAAQAAADLGYLPVSKD